MKFMKSNKSSRPIPLYMLLASLFVTGIGFIIMLCFTGGSESNSRGSYTDYIISEYDGNFEFHPLLKDYMLVSSGLNGGNNRMTQVYSDGDIEIAFSYRALSETENQFAEEMGTELERWIIDASLGEASLTAYLTNKKTGGFYEIYAESMDMSADELARKLDNNVIVHTPWERKYRPKLSPYAWFEIIDWDKEWIGLYDCKGYGKEIRDGLYKLLSSSEWKCTFSDGSAIDYQALCRFTWQCGNYICRLDVCDDGYVYYYESWEETDNPGSFTGYYSACYKPVSGKDGRRITDEASRLAESLN
jgi:hypothetical protein